MQQNIELGKGILYAVSPSSRQDGAGIDWRIRKLRLCIYSIFLVLTYGIFFIHSFNKKQKLIFILFILFYLFIS